MTVDTELQQLLRLHPEPYTYYDDAAVFRALTAKPAAYLDYLTTLLEAIARDQVALELPPKAVFADPGSPRPETALVVSTGSALFDNLTIDYLLTEGLSDLSG